MIRCILVDDEPKALKILQRKLEKTAPDLEIIGSYTDPFKALEAIGRDEPDLVFLDISMPRLSGFDLLQRLENPSFEVIFVTAYDSFAIQAIKHSAMGYIVKPVDNDELAEAVEKARKNIELKVAAANNRNLLDLLNQKRSLISVPTQNGYIFIKARNIIRLEGIGGYTKIYCKDKKEIVSSYNLGKFLNILENRSFFQTHRSHIINLEYLTGYMNEGYVELDHSQRVPLSKTRKKEFLDAIEKG